MNGGRRLHSGLTMVEVLVAVAILGIVAGGTVLVAPRLAGTIRLETASHLLATDLRAARTLAVASSERVRLALRTGGTSYVRPVETGAADRELPPGITVASVGSGGTLTFSPLGYAENATIVLENRAGTRRAVILNQRGRVSVRRP